MLVRHLGSPLRGRGDAGAPEGRRRLTARRAGVWDEGVRRTGFAPKRRARQDRHVLALLFGCAAAWRPDAPGRFDLVVPPGWEVATNRRTFGTHVLGLKSDAARATITVALLPDDTPARALPLELVAESRALTSGRALGIESGRSHLHQIDLDGHEAWAVTGRRRWQFVEADYTSVYARVGRHLAEITLQAPVGELDRALPAWAIVLDSLRFPLDRVAVDAPLFEPDE